MNRVSVFVMSFKGKVKEKIKRNIPWLYKLLLDFKTSYELSTKFGKWSEADYRLFIHSLIRLSRPRTVVEIGVSKGETTAYICKALKENNIKNPGTVIGFDNWNTHGLEKQFHSPTNKKTVERYLKSLKLNNFKLIEVDLISEKDKFKKNLINELNSKRIDFAFIDACHSYIGIKNDFDIIYPLLNQDQGIIIFDDTLMIDGCREFMLHLRTRYFDGTFDIIDFPFGCDKKGLSILVKRGYPLSKRPIDQICGSLSEPKDIEDAEKKWFQDEAEKNKNDHLEFIYEKKHLHKILSSKNFRNKTRKRGEEW